VPLIAVDANYWLGGLTTNVTEWVTGEEWNYSNWEQSPQFGNQTQCVQLRMTGKMRSGSCAEYNMYICEQELA